MRTRRTEGVLVVAAAVALGAACAATPPLEAPPTPAAPAAEAAPAPATPAPAPAPSVDRGGLAGRLLVAQPLVRDPHFAKSVILVVRHDDTGALGVVLDRVRGTRPAAQLLADLGHAAEGDGQLRIHYGGPVAGDHGYLVYSPPGQAEGELLVTPSIAVGFDVAILERVAAGRGPARVFFAVGHAGWGPGQLETELANGGWAVAPAVDEIVFDDDMGTKWRRAMLAGLREGAAVPDAR